MAVVGSPGSVAISTSPSLSAAKDVWRYARGLSARQYTSFFGEATGGQDDAPKPQPTAPCSGNSPGA
jgi:hypothetical protein